MMRSLLFIGCIGLILSSCGGDARGKEEIKSDIESLEKKIEKLSTQVDKTEEIDRKSEELVKVLLEFYHAYPKDQYAASCVAKVHMTYSRTGDIEKAAAYGDTLLKEFPKFPDRAQIIESQIMSYEMLIKPRNVEKIRGYLEMWLKENKNAPKEKIEDMKYHLEFVGVPLEDRMRMNMENLD